MRLSRLFRYNAFENGTSAPIFVHIRTLTHIHADVDRLTCTKATTTIIRYHRDLFEKTKPSPNRFGLTRFPSRMRRLIHNIIPWLLHQYGAVHLCHRTTTCRDSASQTTDCDPISDREITSKDDQPTIRKML